MQGMTSLISQYSPAIIFEYEDWAWRKAGSAFQDVFDLLCSRSYSLWHVRYGRHLELRAICQGDMPDSHAEVLAIANCDLRMQRLQSMMKESQVG